jgi:hypothetical protein
MADRGNRANFSFKFTQPNPPNVNKKGTAAKAEWLSDRAFYTCNAAWNIIEYIEGKAVRPQEQDGRETRKDKTEIFKGLFNTEKFLSKTEVEQMKERMRHTKSNVWDGYVSFDKDVSQKFTTAEQAIAFVKRTFDDFISKTHLKRDNVEVVFGLHTDQPHHHHVHYVFWEKEPLLRKNGKTSYTNKGTLSKEARAQWKLTATNYFEENKMYTFRDEIRQELNFADGINNYEHNDLLARQKLRELALALPKKGRTSYGSDNMKQLRPLVDETVKYLLNIKPTAEKTYKDMLQSLADIRKQEKEILTQSKIFDDKAEEDKFLQQRYDDLKLDMDRRLGNEVIKMAKDIRYAVDRDAARTAHYSKRIGSAVMTKNISRGVRSLIYTLPTTWHQIKRDFTENSKMFEYRLLKEQLNEKKSN